MDHELLLNRVREKLRSEDVKLWLPPYTTETHEKGEIPTDLIKRYAAELSAHEEDILSACENLRTHAVNKLSARTKFQSTGIATLKIKVTAGAGTSAPSRRVFSLEIGLDRCGYDLKAAVSTSTGLEKMRLKLISAGHVIDDSNTLFSQNIKNGSQILAVVLTGTEADVRQEEQEIADISKTRHAAELLSTRAGNDDTDDFDIQITDQGGRPLALPREEKRSLTLAMTLHEKGRAALKSQKYSKALLLLLEADKEFKYCRAEILDCVDNFAILCLDIVWCYLCLENISELPDAERRLYKCELAFKKSYGEHNERLKLLRNGAEVERILLMRLHLLQGIVAFHQNKTKAAEKLLTDAADEFNLLQVDPGAIAHLMELGLTAREARIGMRACQGNPAAAVEFIMKNRQEKEERYKKEKQEREDRKLAKKYGRCANGDSLIMENVRALISMNFPRAAAVEALKQVNNSVGRALDLLQEHPELLEVQDIVPDHSSVILKDADIAQCVSLGFDAEAVKTALKKHRNNLQKAVDDLIKYNGMLPYSSEESSSSPSSSGSDSPAARKREEENQIIDDLISDITRDEMEYLDPEMTEERQFLDDYLARLSSLQH